MTTLPNMTGTPRTVEIKGKEYKVSPVTIDDLAKFEVIIKDLRNKSIREALKEAELPDEIIARKIMETVSKTISLRDIREAMETMAGTRYLLWCVLKKDHPEIKLEEMGELVDIENLKYMTDMLSELGGEAARKRKNESRGPKKK